MPQYVPSSMTGLTRSLITIFIKTFIPSRLCLVRIRGDGSVARRIQHLPVSEPQEVEVQQLSLHGVHTLQDRLTLPL